MTIRLVALALVAGLSMSCVTDSMGRRGGLNEAQIAALPPDVQKAYDVFAQKCSRCHTLSRPLGSGITDMQHWREYVARMRRQPGSGISYADAETVLVFLKYYSDEKLRAQAERRSEPPPDPSPPAPISPPSSGPAPKASSPSNFMARWAL